MSIVSSVLQSDLLKCEQPYNEYVKLSTKRQRVAHTMLAVLVCLRSNRIVYNDWYIGLLIIHIHTCGYLLRSARSVASAHSALQCTAHITFRRQIRILCC
jgi:hypothetical protein